MKLFRLLIFLAVIVISCQKEENNISVISDDGLKKLTIVSDGKEHIIYSHLEKLDYLNNSDIIKTDGFYEHYNGLVKWENDTTYLYFNYGDFQVSSKTTVKVKVIVVDEFERLKSTNGYKYFYF